MTDTPHWFQDGLRFSCTGCGKCCTGSTGYVWVTEEEMAAIATQLGLSTKDFIRKYTRQKGNRYALTERKQLNGDYDCVFLKDKQCQIYQNRPRQCRTFPWWQENLNTESSWEEAARECEGIHDEAPLVSYEDIITALGYPDKK